jgi:hypothetical protein
LAGARIQRQKPETVNHKKGLAQLKTAKTGASQYGTMTSEDKNFSGTTNFDRLMRGLVAVDKDELKAEEQRERSEKAKADKPRKK